MKQTLILLNLLFTTITFTQKAKTSFINYNSNSGLPSSEVYDIIQDSVGYIWFATDRGISKFNSKNFTTYTKDHGLTDDVVFRFYKDYKNRIWLLTKNGKLSYLENDSIVSYKYNHLFIKHLSKRKYFNSFYVDKNDNVFIGTFLQGFMEISKKGQVRNNNDSLRPGVYFKNINNSLFSYSKQSKNEKQVYHLNGKPIYNERESGLRSECCYLNDSLFCFNSKFSLTLYNVKHKAVLDNMNFEKEITFLKHIDNHIYIGLKLGGLRKISIKNNKLNTDDEYLNSITCSSILKDNRNGIWISTIEHGVFYSPDMSTKIYNTKNGLFRNYVKCLNRNNKTLGIGFGNSFQTLKDYSLSEPKSSSASVGSYNTNKKNLFLNKVLIQSKTNLKIFDRNANFIFPNLKANYISVLRKNNEKLYIGNGNEIYLVEKNKLEKLTTFKNLGRIYDIFPVKRDSIFVASDSGLYVSRDNNRLEKIKTNAIFSKKIISIKKSPYLGWVFGTKRSGIIIHNDGKTIKLTTKNHLASNNIVSINMDDQHNIWVSTNKGINKINAKDPSNVNFYSMADGLISNEITGTERIDNILYVGTKKGLNSIDLTKHQKDTLPLKLGIESIKLNGKLIKNTPVIHMHPKDKFLEINYFAFNYQSPKETEYRYRIIGNSNSWVYTINPQLIIHSLKEKKRFTIEIQAKRVYDKVWKNNSLTVKIKVHPPFYKTTFFYIIISLLLFAFIYFSFKLNILEYNKHVQHKMINLFLKKLGVEANLVLTINKEQVKIKESSIIFFQAFKDYVEIHTDNKKYLYRITMKKLEEELSSKKFIRVHRSFIINKDKIDAISKSAITIEKHKIPIGVTYKNKLISFESNFSKINGAEVRL